MRFRVIVSMAILVAGLLVVATQCPNGNLRPVASFTPDPTSGPSPLSVNFDASASYDPDGHIVSYEWDFGDGEHTTGVEATHVYQQKGTFMAVLTVRDNEGALNSAQQAIAVEQVTPEFSGSYYVQFIGFPDRFFVESSVPKAQVLNVVAGQYFGLKDMHNGIAPYDRVTVEYDAPAYGCTTPTGFKLGDPAFPSPNAGHHRWAVMGHEQGHNFFGGTSAFYGALAFPYPFLQESLAVLSTLYVYHYLLNHQADFQLTANTVASLNYDYSNERAFQQSMYQQYINQGQNFDITEVLTSQALDYKMIVFGELYGWMHYQKFTKAFQNAISSQFSFQDDGTSSIEQSTYVIAALSVSFATDFRDVFRSLGFPIDETLYNTIYNAIWTYVY